MVHRIMLHLDLLLKCHLTACSPLITCLVVYVHVHSVITNSNSVKVSVDTRMSGICIHISGVLLYVSLFPWVVTGKC